MFSLVLSALIINNKLNGVAITPEFYNFAIFCIAVDVLVLLALLWSIYNGVRNSLMYGLVIIYIQGIIQSSLLVNSKQGTQITQDAYLAAIAYVSVLGLINIYLYGNKAVDAIKSVWKSERKVFPY